MKLWCSKKKIGDEDITLFPQSLRRLVEPLILFLSFFSSLFFSFSLSLSLSFSPSSFLTTSLSRGGQVVPWRDGSVGVQFMGCFFWRMICVQFTRLSVQQMICVQFMRNSFQRMICIQLNRSSSQRIFLLQQLRLGWIIRKPYGWYPARLKFFHLDFQSPIAPKEPDHDCNQQHGKHGYADTHADSNFTAQFGALLTGRRRRRRRRRERRKSGWSRCGKLWWWNDGGDTGSKCSGRWQRARI